MSESNIDEEDVVSPLKKPSRRPSTPKSKPSSPILSQTGVSASTSQLNDKPHSQTDKEKNEEKKSNSIWGLLSFKKHPPSTLDIPKAVKRDSSTTPSGSLSFLHRFSFAKHSPATTPYSSYPEQFPESALSRPTDLLFPVKELGSLEGEEEVDRDAEKAGSPVHEEHWFVPADDEEELNVSTDDEKMNTALQVMSENESTRDSTIKELESFLNEFRSGKLRALKDTKLEEMREMHREQVEISALQVQIHNQLLQHDGYESDKFGDLYKKLGAQLDRLHGAMESFGAEKTPQRPKPHIIST